jgi:hypothetical protein
MQRLLLESLEAPRCCVASCAGTSRDAACDVGASTRPADVVHAGPEMLRRQLGDTRAVELLRDWTRKAARASKRHATVTELVN